jgi:hypothetical protein
MNRRRFIASSLAAVTGLTLDPERLLWVPGAKTIFIPRTELILSPGTILPVHAATVDAMNREWDATLYYGAGSPEHIRAFEATVDAMNLEWAEWAAFYGGPVNKPGRFDGAIATPTRYAVI